MPGHYRNDALRLLQWVLSSASIGIAGSGRVAQALGRLLHERGEPIACVASRDPARARTAAEFIGHRVLAVEVAEVARHASLVIIAVSDRGLPDAASALASAGTRQGIVLHTCGAKDIEELTPLRKLGWDCGTLHPLQSISSPAQGLTALPGCTFAVSGDAPALKWARHMAETVGGHAVQVTSGRRALYHAAAVMASNYSVSLLDAAGKLMSAATGVESDASLRMLAPLVRTSMENAFTQGTSAALTGPIERGDGETVALHLDAIDSEAPSIRDLYVAAGLQTLKLARRKGLAEEAAASVEAVLGRGRA